MMDISTAQKIPRSTDIVEAEYFVGSDPGLGNGIKISISSPKKKLSFDLTDLNLAVNQSVYIRVKNGNGHWSRPRSFQFKGTGINKTARIQSAEYFIGADPGVGKGTPVSTNPNIVSPLEVNKLKVKKGDIISLRVRDTQRRTSRPLSYVWNGVGFSRIPAITRIEYFIDNDPGLNNGTPLPVSSSNKVDFSFSLSDFLYPKTLYIRTQNANGLWGLPMTIACPNRYIQRAELVLSASPDDLPVGQGIQMTAMDGAFDSPVEKVQRVLSDISPDDIMWVRVQSNDYVWSRPVGNVVRITQPPRLQTPMDAEVIKMATPPQPVLFSWTAATSSQSDASIEYSLHVNGTNLDTSIYHISTLQTYLKILKRLHNNEPYTWTVFSHIGAYTEPSPDTFTFYADVSVQVDESELSIPEKFDIRQNYPNPFNSSTVFRVDLPKKTEFSICIYDITGRIVATLFDGVKAAGQYKFQWQPEKVATGIYLCRFESYDFFKTLKMAYIQ